MTAAETQPKTGPVSDQPDRTATARDAWGLSVLGTVAVVLVLYSYLVALWPNRQGETFGLVVVLRRWVNEPLGIGADFGFVGIALLLLIAGYLGARSMDLEPLGRFAMRILVMFYALAVFTAGLAFLILLAGGELYTAPADVDPDGGSLVATALLIAPVTASVDAVPFAIVLTSVLVFLIVAILCRPLARIHPAWAILTQILLCAVPVFVGVGAEGPLRSFGLLAFLLPVVIIGQITWSVRHSTIPLWLGVLLGMTTFQVMAWAEHSYRELLHWWYPLSAVFAVLLLLLALNHPPRFGAYGVFQWFFDRRHTILLFIPTIGWATQTASTALPVILVVVLGIGANLAAADAYHRFIETGLRRLLDRARSPGGS
ncbi:multisubunit Na+/H+ antiporter MnhC subunit [Actinoalloteichus hoggarensis]|uniref:Uncharacterized protein n=1 Tax=Actinoalloteichus hoggarensis TaxID=1470176 RepID=A0A221VW15_9PSEU|nr:hypothetical protein [Actinoalloteichus hoggarensis]ASO17739.1 hypothetical protein AHOG_00320 [Actinoalloteichus hoggarensis]MBB5922865.1 multisubunit Na+/H+ antiporter MnhC subunit [Actinoalloteichus hoggarensis]